MYKNFLKRFFDVLLSGLALLVLSPILLIVAIFIRIKLGSPVIFKQERPGKDGKIFKMYKFRTMLDPQTRDGRKLTDKERLECIEKGIDILTDEERLPKFGRILRATSLDELPELWNIFIGDMSIVGE
jgi:Sugar transferases involved in lipopolysaccharide synthesis